MLFSVTTTNAQDPVELCGFYNRDTSLSNNDYSGPYFDQFGNNYATEELLLSTFDNNVLSVSNCQSGYFNLIFEGSFSDGEIETVCAAFSYLSGVIIPVSQTPQVNILLTKEYMQNDESEIAGEILATGQAFFSDECGINRSLAYMEVNSLELNPQFIHGIIRYNQLINIWHLVENDGQGQDPAISGIDLFSVTIHEALHVFAWHSLTHDQNDEPIADGHYSVFDQFLKHESGGVKRNFLAAASQPGCCNKFILNPELGAISSSPPICDKVTFEAMFYFVNVAVGKPYSNMVNHLSHFNESCDEPATSNYVMHPSISLNQNKRNISTTEKNAMCAMGFSISGSCSENGCITVANDDGPVIITDLNDPYVINSGFYLNNDTYLYNDNPALFVISHIEECDDLVGCNLDEGIEVDFDDQTNSFTITALEPGFYSVCYSIKAWCEFGFKCDDAVIFIYVENPEVPECCSESEDCHLICDGYFENIDSTLQLRQLHAKGDGTGANTFTFGMALNQPVLVEETFEIRDCNQDLVANVPLSDDGKAVKLTHGHQDSTLRMDGIVLTLCRPLEPGQTLDVSFDALASPDCYNGTAELHFELAECLPAGGENVYEIPGIIAGPEVKTIASGTTMNNYNVAIANNSNGPARYLFVHHELNLSDTTTYPFRSFVVIDNMEAFYNEGCITVEPYEVVPHTPCPEGKVSSIFKVCNNCSALNGTINVGVDIPELMEIIPTGSVPSVSFSIPAGELHPNACKYYEVLVDVGDDSNVIENVQTVTFTIDDLDSCTLNDTASLSFIPVDTIPISISKELVWQDTLGQTGIMRFMVVVCNESDYFVNNIEIEDKLSYLVKIHDKIDFSIGYEGLYKRLSLSSHSCDTLYFETIPDCICQDSMENCIRARVLQSGCWDIYDCVPTFDDIRTGPVPDPSFWISYEGCQLRCFDWEPNMCDGCQTNIWDFGDGTTSYYFFPCHQFPDTGTYVVTHHTFNLCGDTIASDTVIIWEFLPDPAFSFQVAEDCDSIQFTSATQEYEHGWDFGNGQTSTDVNPGMTYDTDGTYDIVHCVRHDSLCGWVCDTLQVTIYCHGTCNCPDESGNYNVGKFNQTTNLSTLPFATGSSHNNSGNCISVKGKLFIDKPFTLIGGEVRMNPGSEIIIPDTTGLTLQVINENGGIHGCDTLWQGITMLTDAYLNMSRNIVQDGYQSVKFQSRGTAIIVENDFDRNHIGIQIESSILSFANTALFSREVFSGNNFDCTNVLFPTFSPNKGTYSRSLCGINIDRMIAIIGTDDPDFPNQNEYLNLLNGIRMNQSLAFVHNQHIHSTYVLPPYANSFGSGIYAFQSYASMNANRIEQIAYNGIEMIRSGSPFGIVRNKLYDLKFDGVRSQQHRSGHIIMDNDIQGADYNGISLRIGMNLMSNFIQSNSIVINPSESKSAPIYGISLWDIPGQYSNYPNQTNVLLNEIEWDSESSWANLSMFDIKRVGGLLCSSNQTGTVQNHRNFGFWLGENNKMIVSDNFYQNAEFENSIFTVGYSINASPNGLICCNSSSNARFGYQFNGNSPNRWDGNVSTDDHYNGLVVTSESIMGQQYHDQSQVYPIVQGNEWLATYSSGLGASNANLSSDPEILGSLIYYNSDFTTTATLNNHQYGSGDPEGDWFKTLEESDPAFCNSEENICSSIIPPVHLTDADEHAARGYFIDSVNGYIALNWEIQRNLLHNIAADSALLGTNAIIDSFYSASSSMMVFDVVYFERYLDSIRQYPISDQERMTECQDSMLVINAAIANLDTLIPYASTLEDTLQIFDDKYSLLLSINHWLSEMLELDSLQQIRLVAGISQLNSQIGNWTPANLVDSNYAIGYLHYLDVLGDHEHLFDSTSLVLLHTVADQCPQLGGNIVYLCRSLIQNQDTEAYWDDEVVCIQDTSRSNISNIKDLNEASFNEVILVFPNPASDMVHIQSKVKFERLDLQVYDAYGVCLYSGQLNFNTTTLISVDSWSDGLYAFVFTDNQNRKMVTKVAIIRR